MASTQLTKPPKKKAKFLKPDQIPEVTLDSDSQEFENDNSETMDDEKNNEQLGLGQSLLQQEQAP
jgi:hypothetical protein